MRASPTSSSETVFLRATNDFNGSPWQDSIEIKVDNPDAGRQRSAGFIEPDQLICYGRIILIFECEVECDGGMGEPLAFIQWYDGYVAHPPQLAPNHSIAAAAEAKRRAEERREAARRRGADIFRHPAMPTQPCMALEDKFDVISLDSTVESCAWVVKDFDIPRRYWRITHSGLPNSYRQRTRAGEGQRA